MYTGSLIADLLSTVERAERFVRARKPPVAPSGATGAEQDVSYEGENLESEQFA